MPQFKLKSKAFIAPHMYPEGAIIEYDGPLGINFEAIDEEGEALLEAWYKEHPHAGSPIDALPIRGERPEPAAAEMVQAPPPPTAKSLNSLAQPGRAQPGPTELPSASRLPKARVNLDTNGDGKVDLGDLKK